MDKINKMEKIKIIDYKNATVARFTNTRCVVATLNDDTYGIEFTLRSDDLKPRVVYRAERNKIVTTRFNISKTGAMAIMHAIHLQLLKDGEVEE